MNQSHPLPALPSPFLPTPFCYVPSSPLNLGLSPSSDLSLFSGYITQPLKLPMATSFIPFDHWFSYFSRYHLKGPLKHRGLGADLHSWSSDLKANVGTQEPAFPERSQRVLMLQGQGPPLKVCCSRRCLPNLN